MIAAMGSRVRRFVLWLLVAAVPWHVGAVAAMDHGALAVPPAASAPCHDETMAASGHEAPEAHAAADAAQAGKQPSTHCAACLACCAFAAPPAAVPVLGQAQPLGRLRPGAGIASPTFLTGGPLRPPRSLSA